MASDSDWSESRPLLGVPSDSQEPVLAATTNVLNAVWASSKILYHACMVEGQWQAPHPFASGEQPALAAGPDDSLHCVFSHWFLGNCEIYYTRRAASGVWSLPQVVSRTTGVSSQPALSVGQDGRVHVAWADTTSGPTTVYYAQQRGSAWANAPIPNAQGSRPAIAAALTGEIHVAWQDRLAGAEPFEILASFHRDGKWSVPDIVSDNPLHHSFSPALAVTQQGTCHLVWQEERRATYVVRHAERLPEGWSPPEDISTPGAGDARLPRISVSPKGFVQVLWLQDAVLMHRSRSSARAASWSAEEVACDACAEVSGLAASISPASAELHAVWSAYEDSDQRRLYHAYRKALLKHTLVMPTVVGPG